jgi:hypothetical protein
LSEGDLIVTILNNSKTCPSEKISAKPVFLKHFCGNIIPKPSSCCVKYYRAILNTCTTSRATILDNRAGTLFDLDLEISGRSLHAFKVRISDELDV